MLRGNAADDGYVTCDNFLLRLNEGNVWHSAVDGRRHRAIAFNFIDGDNLAVYSPKSHAFFRVLICVRNDDLRIFYTTFACPFINIS